ncbi:MAG: class I SAM-dependent methyltransferase [Verrucomicrobiota bacterium JB023]|nr:class I SAM-dependent methyltransferase [Verrucomicrobiota bacterium JB023]
MPHRFLQKLKYLLKWRRHYDAEFASLPDRQIYDEEILPYFSQLLGNEDRILDIGCEWYNLHHQRHFRAKDYHTLDILPDRAAFGGKKHVVGSALELDQHFPQGSMALVLLNGIFGWGVNGEEEQKQLVVQLAHVLREGGYLLVGWNDTEANRPERPPGELLVNAGFQPWVFPPRGAETLLANEATGHTFEFYRLSS